jgi:RNA polymerase sigma-B factor
MVQAPLRPEEETNLTVLASAPEGSRMVKHQVWDVPDDREVEERKNGATADYTDVEELFTHLADCRTGAERGHWRERIIITCLPLADHIAYRYVGRGEPPDDLIQVARVGLIKTVDRYQPGRGHFVAFAVPTIMGEVRRHFRDFTWTVRVPRKVQETQARVRAAVDTMSQRMNRTPTTSEIARELGVDPDQILESQAASWAYHPASLDVPLSSESKDAGVMCSTWERVDSVHGKVEDSIVLREAIAGLDPRRRAIVGMIFFEELTQRQIARRLGVSQAQISRLLSDTLTQMRLRICRGAPCRQASEGADVCGPSERRLGSIDTHVV